MITGAPRSGRTTLAVQLARLIATSGAPVQLRLGWDDPSYVAAMVRAGRFGTDLGRTWLGEPTLAPTEPALDLPIDLQLHQPACDMVGALRALPAEGAVAIDDVDLHVIGDPLDFVWHLSSWARDREHRRLAVVSMPSHVLGVDSERWQAWTRLAAAVVETAPRDLGGSESELRILSNQRGPASRIKAEARFGAALWCDAR